MAKRVASDLTVLTKWFAAIDGPEFLALPAPTRGRHTQSEGREDANEELADRSLPATTPYAFWHWQSHERAFGRKGELVDDLLLHWHGSHDDVAERLATAPEPFTVDSAGPAQAFVVSKPYPLPPPDDRRAVGPAVERLVRAVATGKAVTGEQRNWVLAVAGGSGPAADDAFRLVCDLDLLTRDLVAAHVGDDLSEHLTDPFGVWRLRAWARVDSEHLTDLVRPHAAHPIAAAVLGEPVGPLDTDADDAPAVTAALLWQARDAAEAVAVVAPWIAREHTLSTWEGVVALLAQRLHGGAHHGVAPARMLDLAEDDRLPRFWCLLAASSVGMLGGLEHLQGRLDPFDSVSPRPFSAWWPDDPQAPVIAGDRARLRSLASANWELGSQPTVLRADADRTRALAATAALPLGWFWTWPDEQAAFASDGRLIGPLPVHLVDATAADVRESLPPRFEFVAEPPTIHPGACPPLEDILDRLATGAVGGPARYEDLDYVRATYLRHTVQGQRDTLDRARAATLFDVWRVHDGARVPGAPAELLAAGTVRGLIDDIYAPGGPAERSGHGNGYPFLPFARDVATGDLHHLDMRHRIPPVHTAAPGATPAGEPVAPDVDTFLADHIARGG